MKLNLGAGNVRLREGYVTLDANAAHSPDILATVPPIPLPDASCDTVFASHFLEHLDNDQVVELFREVWRVLELGGTFEAVVPYALSHGAFQDPTHKSFWVPERFLYHTPHFRELGYGLEDRFRIAELNLNPDPRSGEVRAVLVKAED